MYSKLTITALGAMLSMSFASPTPAMEAANEPRQANPFPSKITSQAQLDSIIAGLQSDATAGALGASALANLVSAIAPAANPTAIADELSSVASVYQAHPTSFVQSGFDLFFNGLTADDAFDLFLAETVENSNANVLNPPVFPPIYPKKASGDAPYDVPELTLRSAIYIPPTFTYGKVRPVIFVPGTASYAGSTFGPNFYRTFQGSNYADAVFLNIPNANLDDIQTNAEYVAYAMNYISALTKRNDVAVLTWSAGSVDSQWAFQYWPSTRKVVTDLIDISGDFHGTVLAYLICPNFPAVPCPPSVIQQQYNSKFIATLRNGGGDSAYVPTTTVYSIFDEIVQPQAGVGASSYILDKRNVGVSNTELQSTCLAQPAGTLYFHESVLFNSIASALTIDALKNAGPGQLSRIDVAGQCQKIAADGLSLADVLATEALIPAAGAFILTYPNKVTTEPPIKAYAQKDVPAGF